MSIDIELPSWRGLPPLVLASDNVARRADATGAVTEASDAVFRAASDVGTWTGSVLWDAAEVLSRYLTTLPAEFWRRSPTCCELGCGSGIVGLTAAALTDAPCCITDRHVHLARWNADQNFRGEARERISATELSWGDSRNIAAIGGPFDVILGLEVVYDKLSHVALAETIAALSHDRTTVLLSTQDGGPDESLALSAPFWRKLTDDLGFECEDIVAEDASVGLLVAEYGGHPIADYWTSGNRGNIALVRARKKRATRGRL